MIIFDSHNHVFKRSTLDFFSELEEFLMISCAWTETQYYALRKLLIEDPSMRIVKAFGIHPWYADEKALNFLEQLLVYQEPDVIGECGLDFFDDQLRLTKDIQIKCWEKQLEMAVKYKKGLIIHERKALQEILVNWKELKAVPFVIFHSWNGSLSQAQWCLNKGINGFFSFGKAFMSGKKSCIECVKKLPVERILIETDFQEEDLQNGIDPVKRWCDIYEKAVELRGQPIPVNRNLIESLTHPEQPLILPDNLHQK